MTLRQQSAARFRADLAAATACPFHRAVLDAGMAHVERYADAILDGELERDVGACERRNGWRNKQ